MEIKQLDNESLVYEHKQIISLLHSIQIAVAEGNLLDFGQDDALYYVWRKFEELNKEFEIRFAKEKGGQVA